MVGLVFAGVLIDSFIRSADTTFLYSLASHKFRAASEYIFTPEQLHTIVHYATSQQKIQEISITLKVYKHRSPCSFLVLGLKFDFLMWNSLNRRGRSIFNEEDPSWSKSVLKEAPTLNTHTVQYRTQLKKANRLLNSYRKEPLCSPAKTYSKGNYKFPLALIGLSEEVYGKEVYDIPFEGGCRRCRDRWRRFPRRQLWRGGKGPT
ncbi:Probable methyltransferase At1g27930 [Linum perenne]